MKNFKALSSFLLIVLILMACDSSDPVSQVANPENIESLFEQDMVTLDGEKLTIQSDSLNNAFSMLVVDSLLFISSPSRRHLFKIVDLNAEEFIANYGVKGNGPGEIGFPSFLQRKPGSSEDLMIFSKRTFTYYETSVASMLTSSEARPEKKIGKVDFNIQKIAPIKDGRFMAAGIYHNRYATLGQGGDTINTFFDYPFREEFKNVKYGTLAMAYQGKIRTRPDGERAIFAVTNSANFDIVDFDDVDNPRIIKSLHSWKPSFNDESAGNAMSISIKRDNRYGYADVAVTDKYIYLLFSGRTSERDGRSANTGDKVFVFDWDGNPVKSYKLEEDTRVFTVNENDQYLYTFVDAENPFILKYVL